ncbi:MAG: hypothetical protein JSW19_02300 [Candidatus Bathyarchaeota archaeon]|nr:MAG: hypothetical protein JSW19_02300 [Candidatus Bathyarchaeota archaeon]
MSDPISKGFIGFFIESTIFTNPIKLFILGQLYTANSTVSHFLFTLHASIFREFERILGEV